VEDNIQRIARKVWRRVPVNNQKTTNTLHELLQWNTFTGAVG